MLPGRTWRVSSTLYLFRWFKVDGTGVGFMMVHFNRCYLRAHLQRRLLATPFPRVRPPPNLSSLPRCAFSLRKWEQDNGSGTAYAEAKTDEESPMARESGG
ncbi:unnamed protein product, partial [Scytosiphon promiscuus]